MPESRIINKATNAVVIEVATFADLPTQNVETDAIGIIANGTKFLWSGTQWILISIGGADNVNISGQGTAERSKNREMAALTTVQDATWTVAENVRHLEIIVIPENATNSALNFLAGFTFDSPTDALRDAALTLGSHLTDDSEIDPVTREFKAVLDFPEPLIKCSGIRLYGAEDLHVFLLAS